MNLIWAFFGVAVWVAIVLLVTAFCGLSDRAPEAEDPDEWFEAYFSTDHLEDL